GWHGDDVAGGQYARNIVLLPHEPDSRLEAELARLPLEVPPQRAIADGDEASVRESCEDAWHLGDQPRVALQGHDAPDDADDRLRFADVVKRSPAAARIRIGGHERGRLDPVVQYLDPILTQPVLCQGMAGDDVRHGQREVRPSRGRA